jgi:hypothetical protein
MAERTPGLSTNHESRSDHRSPRAAVEELGGEVAGVREELDTLLSELDRRRHEALDVPLQLRRHAFGAGLTAMALVAAAAGSVWLAVWRRRRRARLSAKAGRFYHALSRMTEHPERVATEPSIPKKIATAAANVAVAALVKKVLERTAVRLMGAGSHQMATQTPARFPAPRPIRDREVKAACPR